MIQTVAVAFTSLVLSQLAFAAPPSFRSVSGPDGWTVVKGEAEPGAVRSARAALPLDLKTIEPLALPAEVTFRFREAQGDSVTFQVLDEGPDAKPLLSVVARQVPGPLLYVTAHASSEPMSTVIASQRPYNQRTKNSGTVYYGWHFPKVKNLWDESDRREIGAAYAKLVPLEEKTFVLRFTITAQSRQVWLDDRLLAESHTSSPRKVWLAMQLGKGAQVLSAEISKPVEDARFIPVPLAHWSHAKTAQVASADAARVAVEKVPMLLPKTSVSEINLGDSLYRYRQTNGGGPDTGYVNALKAWPGSFEVDPASLTFRVPYRTYQYAHLLAWVDETPNAVPRGAFRFYRNTGGYPASTDFEISEEAVARGDVVKLARKNADGKQLYLVKVRVSTPEFYGMRDMADEFLEFELSKPLALARSYPDPIYYGYHPAGLPSSIHVVAITLEQAAFSYEVKPKQMGFVYEQPEKPVITVAVTNHSEQAIATKVSATTMSFDEKDAHSVNNTVALEPGETKEVPLELDVKRLGWHKLSVEVEGKDGCKDIRYNELSLVWLPPNTRTYGEAANETRFGTWNLLGHYTPLNGERGHDEALLLMLRKLGLRQIAMHEAFFTPELLKQHNFLPTGPHTQLRGAWKNGEPDAVRATVAQEVARLDEGAKITPAATYFYGGEWGISRMAQHAAWPFYTGDGDRDLTDEERTNVTDHIAKFTAIGRGIRAKYPQAQRILQWGNPLGTLAYMRGGMPKDLVDGYGMDAPMFELFPESSNATGSVNELWMFRKETQRLGWPQLPIHWTEGPFFPTNPGALTTREQMDYQVRFLLLGIGYGVESFQAGIVPHDAGNYYGTEHYGAGIFHRIPLECPKPAVAAVATMTSMLCGADAVGGVDTGSLTTYCMGFQRVKDGAKIYALWRATGTLTAQVKVRGTEATLTDAMGNATKLPVKGGAIEVPISPTPIWLTGVEKIESFTLGVPTYETKPAAITRPLTDMSEKSWTYEGSEDKAYAYNHFSVRRIPDPELKAEFSQGEEGHADAVAIALPVEKGDRPLATRYGALKPKKPIAIPGKPSELGLWVKGNSSWGRVIYQVRDAKGELWTATGTKDDWNCDDTHAWSSVNFDGWRYIRFPLPGTAPWDNSRELETTWWGSRGGDGIVDLPLSVEKIILEARNEVPVLGVMTTVPERSYKLSQLVAEYECEENAAPAIIAKSKLRMPTAVWAGPVDNTFARLTAEGAGAAPELREFTEPPHFNDGRRMIVHFTETPDLKYNLYLSIYPDGRGADLLKAGVKSEGEVTGVKPEIPMYLFLTSVAADKKESKPSKPVKLITHDNFAEK
jgi:hypothetical protein